jgi:hypothetical protein
MRRPGWLDVVLCGAAPGALAGAQVGGLLFFLNPDLPFTAAAVARAGLLYAAMAGLASLALHLPWTWGRPRRARRWLPWTVTLALAAAAVMDATQASRYAYYLPAGINDRLIRTALWLGLGALISFYTALLHTLHRRRYGRRSRAGYVLIALLSVYVMVERREAFHPRPQPTLRPALVEVGRRPRLWVVALDSATLDAVLPLAGQGRLPFFATLLRDGAYGNLESLAPPRREALWMTLATGKWPFKHGITGGHVFPSDWIVPGSELRLLPVGIRFPFWGLLGAEARTTRFEAREALAFWEVLPRLGMSAGVVGWPASWPPSRETVFTLPEQSFSGAIEPGSTWPEDLARQMRLFRVSPGQIDPVLRARFGERPPEPVLEALAGDLWRESAAAALAAQHPDTEALFLVLPGLREVSRRDFGGFHAVQFEGEQRAEAKAAAEQVAAYYAALDAFLADLWSRQPAPRLLAVVSAYGVAPEEKRFGWGGKRALGGRFGIAPHGMMLLYGDGIRKGSLLTGLRLVDVEPTLLYGLGFPVARDLDGQVVTAAFDPLFLARHPLTFFPSYEGLSKAP